MMKFRKEELIQLTKAWLAISVAFAIVFNGGFRGVLSFSIIPALIMSLITVGLGFILHELSHKYFAQRYGAWAYFRSFDKYLLLGLAMSLLGFVFILPGAVFIRGNISKRQNGIISVAGPIMNLILGTLFLLLSFIFTIGFLHTGLTYGAIINYWLGLFNMLPIWEIDGRKVWEWNKIVFISTFIIALIATFGSMTLLS